MHITALWIYPIKSCGGISVDQVSVVPGGLEHDRRYMLVDEAGQMVTARSEHRLLRVRPRFVAPRQVRVRVESTARELDLDLRPDVADWPIRTVSVWKDQPQAHVHELGSEWFRALLERDVQLVYLDDSALRKVNPRRAASEDVVSFADGYPLLVANETSLTDLNQRLDVPIGMDRFRPNLVVRAPQAFDEDTWERVALGTLAARVPKLCDRCVMTTVDPSTGERGKEPLRTLARFRRWGGAVWFGANVIPDASQLPYGLRVGDAVTVEQRRPHPAISP